MKKKVRTVAIVVIVLALVGFGISRMHFAPAKNTAAERGERELSLSAENTPELESPVEPEAEEPTETEPLSEPEEEITPESPNETEIPAEPETPAETETAPEPETAPEESPAEAPEEPQEPEEPVEEPPTEPEEPAAPPEEEPAEPEPQPEEPTESEAPAEPVAEPETPPAEPERHVCTIEISCWTVAEDLSKLENEAVIPYIPADGWILPRTEMEFTPGETVADILDRATWENDIQIEHRPEAAYGGMYVLGIGFLYAMDAGSESGWMYHVNGQFPNYGCSRYEVQDGDAIVWVYTCDLGRDVGDNSVW